MYVHIARKVQKTLSLDLNVVERREDEENQSKTVQDALEEYWENNDRN